MASGSGEDEWIAEPFAAPGQFTDLQGESYAGKTTLLLSLVSAVAHGATFLERPCVKSDVVYVTEQPEWSLKVNMKHEPGPLGGVHFVTYEDHAGLGFPDLIEVVRKMCREHEARLVVFDTVFEIARMVGAPSRSEARVSELYRSLRPLTNDGAAVVLVRHSAEGGGSLSKTGSGSRAVTGGADTSVRFRRFKSSGNRRTVEVESRSAGILTFTVDRTSDRTYVMVPPAERQSEAAGPSETDASVALVDAVLRALAGVKPPGVTSSEIVARLSGTVGRTYGRTRVDGALRLLVSEGEVVRTGRGRGRQPYWYRLAKA